MTRYLLGVTLVVFVAVLGTAEWLHLNRQTVPPSTVETNTSVSATGATTTTSTNSSSSSSSQTTNAGGYTLADVAKHNSASSCWAAINGNVYDLTNWINQHPGGPEHILAICGTDGSAAFNQQHGGERQPAQELATFKIGALLQ